MEPTTVHASESGHFYYRDGRPCYQVESADGKKMVECDIRHARKLSLVPGVTTITSCAAKPQLTEWKVMQGILASLTLPRRPHEPEAEFIKRVVEDSKAQAKAAAERGTAIHAAVQGHFEGKMTPQEFIPYLDGVLAKLHETFGHVEWQAERSFACPLGFGSKIDLYAQGRRIIVDLKGKEFLVPPQGREKFHYDEHAMQLGAYDKAMDGGHVCANLFISRNVPGLTHIHVWDTADIMRGWLQFEALLQFWQAKQRYTSSWSS